MFRITLPGILVFMLCLTLACQTATPPQSSGAAPTVAEIQPRADEFAAAWDAGNADALANSFTDDCILMPNGSPAVMGKAAVREYYAKRFEGRSRGKATIKTEETGGMGDLVFARGTGSLVSTPKAGDKPGAKPLTLTMKWINISKRQPDRSWKIHRSIFNLDHPNPVPAPPAAGAK